MPAPRFTKDQRLKLKGDIARMRLQQRSTWEIATELSISHTTVIHYLKGIEEEWQAEYKQLHDRKRAAELQRLDRVEREAWDAWFNSLGPTLKTERSEEELATMDREYQVGNAPARPEDVDTASTLLRPRPRAVSTKVTTMEQLGDPRYLEIIRKCVETRAKILGLEPAKVVQVDIRAQAEKAAKYLGKDVSEVLARAEEIAARAWGA